MNLNTLVIGFMNFSVIFNNNKAYKSTRKGYAEYKNAILDPDRLKVREDIFFKHTVPLLIATNFEYRNQGIALKFCVAVGDQLPEAILSRFEILSKEHGDIFSVLKVSEDVPHIWSDVLAQEVERTSLNKEYSFEKSSILVTNFRLDDDDVLSVNYFDLLKKYLNDSFSGFYLTFPNGFLGIYEDGYQSFYKVNRPFIAIGLAKLSQYSLLEHKFNIEQPCIFGSVSHFMVVNSCVSVLDSTKPAFIWTMHRFSDTRSVDLNDIQSQKKIEQFISDSKLVKVDIGVVRECFATI